MVSFTQYHIFTEIKDKKRSKCDWFGIGGVAAILRTYLEIKIQCKLFTAHTVWVHKINAFMNVVNHLIHFISDWFGSSVVLGKKKTKKISNIFVNSCVECPGRISIRLKKSASANWKTSHNLNLWTIFSCRRFGSFGFSVLRPSPFVCRYQCMHTYWFRWYKLNIPFAKRF